MGFLLVGLGKIFHMLSRVPVSRLYEQAGKDSRTGSPEGNDIRESMPMLHVSWDSFL